MPPGNRFIEYVCNQCRQEFVKEDLRAKRVQFMTMGYGQKVIKSRVVEWLCVPCMEEDPDFNRERLADAPGLKDTHLATQD